MQRTDIANSLGAGIITIKYTLTFSDLATGTSTAALTIYPSANPGGNSLQTPSTTAPPNAANFTIPQTGVILYAKIHHTVAFSGGSTTALTASIGKLGGSATFVTPAFNIFQAVADTTLQETFSVPSGQISPWGITFTFTGDGTHNLSAYTAGSVDFYITLLDVTSPTE